MYVCVRNEKSMRAKSGNKQAICDVTCTDYDSYAHLHVYAYTQKCIGAYVERNVVTSACPSSQMYMYARSLDNVHECTHFSEFKKIAHI